MLLVVLLALLGPLLASQAPTQFVGPPFGAPSAAALLGTDYLGRDVLSRLLWGGRTVVWMTFAATSMGMALGVSLGLVAGYSRNALDDAIMRTLDAVLAVPMIILVLLFVSILGPELWLIVLVVAAAWTPGIARVSRGVTLEVVSKEFVQAAEALGVPRHRILFREILPSLTTPLMVEFGLRLTWSISIIAAVSFLGFGIQPPQADWGLMINENRNGISVQPWAVAGPAMCIALLAVGTNLVADGFGRTVAGIDRQGGVP
jgi:peptide/nickel transport system permease protein